MVHDLICRQTLFDFDCVQARHAKTFHLYYRHNKSKATETILHLMTMQINEVAMLDNI
jgi:hypothetical protein